MTKVIKGEFEKLEDLKVKDVSLTCDTSLEVFNNEFNRLSGMDDDLFTYEVEVANILCDSNKDDDSEQRVSHEADDDMGYDPSDIRGDDEVELTDEESSDNEDEVTEVFRIDSNIFDFETPMCKAFIEFNYLLKIDPDLLRTLRDSRLNKNIRMIGSMNGTETYHRLMRNHGLTLEYGKNRNQSNILASLSTIKLDVRNGQHVVGRMMDFVMEETYLELTLLETHSIITIMNDAKP
ncbi:hypothetical protein Tco_0497477 [Tanacetum coccineum]